MSHVIDRKETIPVKRTLLLASTTLLLSIWLWATLPQLPAQAATTSHMLPGTTSPLVRGATVIGQVPTSQQLTLTLTLRPSNAAALARFVTEVVTPNTPLFRHFITPTQFAQAFGPAPATLQAIESFLQASGLHITQVQDGGLAIHATGSVGHIEAALHIALNTYRAADGRTFYANDRNITLPSALVPAIVNIAGLETATQFHPQMARPKFPSHPIPHATCPTASNGGFTVPQMGVTYNFPKLASAPQAHLALLELDGYVPSDISAFAACFASSVNVTNVVKPRLVDTLTALPAGSGAGEDELDIEIALGLAPGIGRIDVYEAPNSGSGWIDLMATIASDNTDDAVSISWGSCEAQSSLAAAQSEDVYFQQMVAQGQNAFASSGDAAAYDCLPNDNSGVGDQEISADDPAANPHVIGVGGTSLTATNTGAYSGETVWNSFSGPNSYSGSGGGYSRYWPAPTWQVSAHVTGNQSWRVVPDIAANAEPSTGTLIYCSSTVPGCGGWAYNGGTSAAAPTWGTLAALTDAIANTRVGSMTPALYALYAADAGGTGAAGVTLNGTTYYDYATQVNGAQPQGGVTVFHDITSGNNTFPTTGFATGYSAQLGFDPVTGLGSMNGQAVANYLAALKGSGGTTTSLAGVYMAAQGSDGSYWVSANLPNYSASLPYANGNWMLLDATQFQGAPSMVSATGGTFWIAGIGTDGTVRVGTWQPAQPTPFSGWSSVTGATCQGNPTAAFASATLFVSCRTPQGGLVINAYDTVGATWGGWVQIGGGLSTSPTMATDGTHLLILAQAPLFAGDQGEWYTQYTIGPGTTTQWRRFMTTCEATPAITYLGATANDYAISCIAGDTSSLWSNTLTMTAQTFGLSGWLNRGAPSTQIGFHNATAVTDDPATSTIYFTGQGLDNAMYLAPVAPTASASVPTWQKLSLAGIFTSNASSAYFGG